jgi:phosphoribosylamine---glycine ligase
MNVLLIGSGGREHALAWKLKQSPQLTRLYIAPGNPATATLGTNVAARSIKEILTWLETNPVDLVVVGPDEYLRDGLTDAVRSLGFKVFGPSKDAAEIEWSKAYAKQLMKEEGIPTAVSEEFVSSPKAIGYVRNQKFPLVIKADGLAAGKGVIIASSLEEAERAINEILKEKSFGEAGSRIIIEEYLEGLEISVHAVCDGTGAIGFPVAKDHKRIGEGDRGPNTGGMGTVAPVTVVSSTDVERIQEEIVLPTLRALKKRGRPFSGLLFPGVMLTSEGPKVIEFNARFGDPETQSYVRLLKSDLLELLYAAATNTLTTVSVEWDNAYACCVVLAAAGYPGEVKKGDKISTPLTPEGVVAFHAGTTLEGDQLVTNGGRVLGITAVGDTLATALEKAYVFAEKVRFEGKQVRKDIGTSVL